MNGQIKHGQQYDVELNKVRRFKEYEAEYKEVEGELVTGLEGTAGIEQMPTDAAAAKVRDWNLSAVQAVLDAVAIVEHATIEYLRLPDVLTGITTVFSKSRGDGSDSQPASQQDFVAYGSGSGSLEPSASAQGSASVMTDLIISITENSAENVPILLASFYVADGTNRADILTKAQTVLGLGSAIAEWPKWRPRTETLIVKSERVNVAVKASTRVFAGGSTESGSKGFHWGNGSSYDIDTSTKGFRINPTIHGALTISSATDTETASATADASTPVFAPGSDIASIPAKTNTITQTKVANGSVSPTTLSATTISAIPTSGYYAQKIVPGKTEFGRIMYQVFVVPFSYFA